MGEIIRKMSSMEFLFVIALPLAAAAVFVFASRRARRHAAAIEAAPTANIGMAADGYCEVEGQAEAVGGKLLTSPLTLSPCIWYHAKVEKWKRGSGRSSMGHWSTVKDSTSMAPFLLRDGTGVCTVYPFRAEVTPSDKSHWYGDSATPDDRNPPRVDPIHTPLPVTDGNFRYRYFEERIYADSPLLVLGEFTQGRFEEHDASDDEDTDVDAEVDEAEALVDEEDAVDEEDVLAAELERKAQQTTRAWIGRGSGRSPFIISAQLQAIHVATSEMNSQAAMSLAWSFVIVAALLLWVRYTS